MRTALALVTLLTLTLACPAAEPSRDDFNPIRKPEAPAVGDKLDEVYRQLADLKRKLDAIAPVPEPTRAAPGKYLSLEDGAARARQEQKGLCVVRKVPQFILEGRLRETEGHGDVFAVAADDDTRVNEGTTNFVYPALPDAVGVLPKAAVKTDPFSPTNGALPPARKPLSSPSPEVIEGPPPYLPPPAPPPQTFLPVQPAPVMQAAPYTPPAVMRAPMFSAPSPGPMMGGRVGGGGCPT